MPTSRSYRDSCAIARGLDVVGERLALLVVRELLLAPQRFSELRQALPHVSSNLLADRLRELENNGVIRRRQATVRDGDTVALLTSWFPASLAEAVPDLLTRTRLTEEIPGYHPAWGEDWVSARPPTSAEAREFGIKRGHPVTVVHTRRFDTSDSVIEYAELIARADTRVVYRYHYSPAVAL